MRILMPDTQFTDEQVANLQRLHINVGLGGIYFNETADYSGLRTLEMFAIQDSDPAYNYAIFFGDFLVAQVQIHMHGLQQHSVFDIYSDAIDQALAADPASFTGDPFKNLQNQYDRKRAAHPPHYQLCDNGPKLFDKLKIAAQEGSSLNPESSFKLGSRGERQ